MKYYILILFSITFLLLSCSKYEDVKKGDEILFSSGYTATAVPADSKATLFENADALKDKDAFGGYFNVKAYREGTSTDHFTAPTTVMYHDDTQNPDWYFYNPQTKELEKRYWPVTYKLDFLAYMPLKRPDAGSNANITQEIDPSCHVTSVGYSNGSGPVFTCNLPVDKAGQGAAKEFIYAWAPSQNKESVSATNGRVQLEFQHPFSAVYVKIGGAHGGTRINSVGFKNIYNQGTYNVTTKLWEQSGNRTNLSSVETDHVIPDKIQLGHTYGPFILMPQDHSDQVKIAVNFTWRSVTQDASVALGAKWEPGKKYTYSLMLGDSAEDIQVKVSVEAWKPAGTNQEIEIK